MDKLYYNKYKKYKNKYLNQIGGNPIISMSIKDHINLKNIFGNIVGQYIGYSGDKYKFKINDDIIFINKDKINQTYETKEEYVKDMTIVITTSPIKAHPNTDLIKEVFKSFKLVGLYNNPIIIMCDGAKINDKIGEKKGNVSKEMFYNYNLYIKELTSISPPNTTIVIRDKRYGFAQNVLNSCNYVKTKYICVVQHDQKFVRPISIPFNSIIDALDKNSDIKYVGLSSLSDIDHFKRLVTDSKFNLFTGQYLESLFGKDNNGDIGDIIKKKDDALIKEILNLNIKKYGIPITPLLFWYDKPHIISVDNIINFVFNAENKVSNFIEDSLGNKMINDVKINGYDTFKKYGCWVLIDKFGEPLVAHLKGRQFVTEEDKAKNQRIIYK